MLKSRQAGLLVVVFGSLVGVMVGFYYEIVYGNYLLAVALVLFWFAAFRIVTALFAPRIKKWTTKS